MLISYNKLANLVNELFGKNVFTVEKTGFSSPKEGSENSFQKYKDDIQELKENVEQDSIGKFFNF